MKLHRTLMVAALGVVLITPGLRASDEDRKQGLSFGALEPAMAEAAQKTADAWLKATGKTDPALLARVQAIWQQEERPVLDRLADVFTLADPAAAKLMADARNPQMAAPTKVPDLFKDQKQPVFYRANLALAFSRALSNRHVYDEALQSLVLFRPEQVVDPSVYLFHRAVCEHALLQKTEAGRTIVRLLEDAQGSPERYRTVGALMLLDMQTWKDKDLGAVARKMKVVEDRLDLARGGPETQKKQREIVARLDELIKELENKQKGSSDPNGGA